MKKGIKIGLVVLAAIMVVLFIVGNKVADDVAKPFTEEEVHQNTKRVFQQMGFQEKAFLETHRLVEWTFSTEEGEIECVYHSVKNPKATLLFLPPVGYDKRLSYGLVPYLSGLGIEVVSYDPRGSRGGERDFTTFGIKEKEDLLKVIPEIKKKTEDRPCYLWGISTGATTISLCLSHPIENEVEGVILDSPWINGKESISKIIGERTTIPEDFLVFLGSMVSRVKYGFAYDDIQTQKLGKFYPGRVLYFASKKDRWVDPQKSKQAFGCFPGKENKLVMVQQSDHGQILGDHPLLYGKELGLFIFKEEVDKYKAFLDQTFGEGASELVEDLLDTKTVDVEEELKKHGMDIKELLKDPAWRKKIYSKP